jgi:hypothetical protein
LDAAFRAAGTTPHLAGELLITMARKWCTPHKGEAPD